MQLYEEEFKWVQKLLDMPDYNVSSEAQVEVSLYGMLMIDNIKGMKVYLYDSNR